MKKLIAALCALLLALSFTACGNKGDETGTDTDTEQATKPQYESSTENGSESESASETESATETESETQKETETEKTYTDDDFEAVNEIVYITSEWLGARTEPKSDAKTERNLKFGQSVKRVGYNEVWSILEIDGTKYYAYSAYMTTTNFTGSDFTLIEDTVMYVTVSSANVRLYPSTEKYATILGAVTKDDAVTCVATNGKWYRVNFKDGFGYVSASCLSDTKTSEQPGFDLSDFTFYEQPITYYVIADKLNVREYPSADNNVSGIKGSFTKDEAVTCYGDNGTWVQVDYKGTKYFVNGNYLARIAGGDPIFGAEEPDLSDFTFYETPVTMYVTASTLNIRQFPSDDDKTSIIKGKFVKDQAVICYGDNGTWVQVDWNGYKYYVGLNFLSKTLGGDPEQGPDLSDFKFFEAPVTMYVITPYLNIRLLPDSESAIMGTLAKDEAVLCTGCNDYWYQIAVGDNTYYVSKEYVTADKPQA